jgi:hypothetical protein
MKRIASVLLPCMILFTAACLLPTVQAQSNTATLSGTVEDEQGAIVPGVKITVSNPATGYERNVTSDESGAYSIPLLPPAVYTIAAERQGFKRVLVNNVVLNVGDQKALRIQLTVGSLDATVNVTGQEALIKDSPEVSTVVDRQFVENMPLNGRSFQNLIDLAPGVVPSTGRGQFNVNGQQATSNYLTVDGVSANIGGSASAVATNNILDSPGSFPGTSATGGFNGLLSVDALQEFRIQTSTYAPEFGRVPGGQISLISRSGNNSLHGTLSEYLRNEAFDSNDWFANRNGRSRSPLRQNDFGGVVGGPILIPKFYDGRNRSFFFFSYEGLRLRIPVSGTLTVPSAGLRQNQTVSPVIRSFLNAFPVPNGRDFNNGSAEWNFSNSNPSKIDTASIRIDQNVGSKVTLFGRYNRSTSQSVTGNFNPSPRDFNIETLTLGSSQVFSSKVNNELFANYSKSVVRTSKQLVPYEGSVPVDQSLIFPSGYTGADSYSFFFFRVQSQQVGTFTYGNFITQTPRQVNLVDNLSLRVGSHQLKFGGDYRYLFPHVEPYKYLPILTIDVLNNNLISGTIMAGQPLAIVLSNFSLYGQDTWRISRRLTATYGLRWDVNTPPKGLNGNDLFTAQGVDNLATATIAPAGTPLFKTPLDNVAPRVGLSYLLRDHSGWETMVRGGFGVFYDSSVGLLSAATASSPYASTRTISNVPFPLSPANAAPLPVGVFRPPVVVFATESGFNLPYSLEWNAAVEQSLGGQQSVSITYLGSAGHRLLRPEADVNPNPNFSQINLYRSVGYSNYRALQIEYKRRLSRGLQALVSYTWARSVDTSSINALYELPLSTSVSPSIDLGPSDFDIRHSFKGAFTYNIPAPFENKVVKSFLKNFSLDALFIAQSAPPVDVTAGNVNINVFVHPRPNLIPDVPIYINDPTAPGGRRFNDKPYGLADNAMLQSLGCLWVVRPAGDTTTPIGPAKGAFCTPANGRQGNFPRNALRGFPLSQLDFALRRQFKFSEKLSLQLRVDLFNAFNHPNFYRPVNNLSDSQFGRSTEMLKDELGGLNSLYQLGGPRSMQFGIKLNF